MIIDNMSHATQLEKIPSEYRVRVAYKECKALLML